MPLKSLLLLIELMSNIIQETFLKVQIKMYGSNKKSINLNASASKRSKCNEEKTKKYEKIYL